MNFQIKENLPVLIEKHLYHKSLNEKILKDSKQFVWEKEKTNPDGGPSNVKALQTDSIEASSFKNISLVADWAIEVAKNWSYGRVSYTLGSAWMANYNKGDYTVSHTHPGVFAFVYFVNTPSGSSPLVFTTSGRRIKAEEGKLVVFSTMLKHHVPKNKCNNRIVLSGNIISSHK
tara:strand:+ start:213 stop:734 length:522 start_codon:yes stop_codon:yes gene_type:complete